MATINSVTGPLDTSRLGFTLMHEHVVISAAAGISQTYPELLGTAFMDQVVAELVRAREGGVNTIVDASTHDLGRDITLLAEAARRSGVNIIATAGWWLDMPRFLIGVSADQFAEIFAREVREGIAGTGIKAALLKAASDIQGVTPEQETLHRAIARAHLATKAPIMLHSYSPGQVARRQLAILKEEGVDLRRVAVDHSNDTTDVEYLLWILDQGCYLGLDRYPGMNVSSQARTKTMKALIDAGFADRLLPSHDWGKITIVRRNFPEQQAERERRNPHGYLYMKNVVFAQLREMGVSEAVLQRLCVVGPRNFLEGV